MDKHKFILFQNFVAGGCGGITATLVGHPFDTIKVNSNLNQIKMNDVILKFNCGFSTNKI